MDEAEETKDAMDDDGLGLVAKSDAKEGGDDSSDADD